MGGREQGLKEQAKNCPLMSPSKIRYAVRGRIKSGKAAQNAIAFRLELAHWCASKNRLLKERTPSLKEYIFYGTLRPPFFREISQGVALTCKWAELKFKGLTPFGSSLRSIALERTWGVGPLLDKI